MALAKVRSADGGTIISADQQTHDNQKAVVPGRGSYLVATACLVAGGVVGTLLFDRVGKAILFNPPEGVGIFALFYIVAQVIERIQEPFTSWLPTGSGSKMVAEAALEKAIAGAANSPAATASDSARAAADAQRTMDQVRANLTVIMFGTSSLGAMLLIGYLKVGLLTSVGVQHVQTAVDIIVSGVAIGAGTKPLHDLITNITKAKETRQEPTAP